MCDDHDGYGEVAHHRAEDINPALQQRATTKPSPLKEGPTLKRQLEQRLAHAEQEATRLKEAINLLGPEEEKTIELLRRLNRLGALQL
jgi:hypothetical protein